MQAANITPEWLKKIAYQIQPSNKVPTITDVIIKDLCVLMDGRGEVTELWSMPWQSEGFLPVQHIYQSATDYGVIKCWHLHEIHTDQFTVTRGKLQLTLVDLREDSPSFGHVNRIFMGTLKPRLVKIPPLVLHGWKALSTPEVLVVNMQTHVYSVGDEYKYPWNCILPDIWEPHNG